MKEAIGNDEGAERASKRQSGFTLDEYDKLILDLDFIVASLHLAFEHDNAVFDAAPIVSEAIIKAHAVTGLIKGMRPDAAAA